jgi:hypothetical protein
VEAVVTRPVFSADHSLLIPEGARLLGDVVEAQRARFLHRNGKVLFVFRQIKLPEGAAQSIQGYLDGCGRGLQSAPGARLGRRHARQQPEDPVHFSSHCGSGRRPVVSSGLQCPGYSRLGHRRPRRIRGRRTRVDWHTVDAVGSPCLRFEYRHHRRCVQRLLDFIARGANVVLPVNTPVKISLKARDGESGGNAVK